MNLTCVSPSLGLLLFGSGAMLVAVRVGTSFRFRLLFDFLRTRLGLVHRLSKVRLQQAFRRTGIDALTYV